MSAADELDAGVLNAGLELAMAWGADWLTPIQPRLAAAYPTLTPAQRDRYDAVCREVMRRGHTLVGELLAMTGAPPGHAAQHQFMAQMLSRWPWVSPENMNRMFSQGCYYAMK